MVKKRTNNLAKYVARILEEKRLSLHDVQVMSGWKITDAYVSSIVRGRARNMSVDKLQALARGLGVDEDEIFRVARRGAGYDSGENRAADPWQSVMVLRLIEKLVSHPDVREILEAVVKLSEEDREVVLKTAKSFSKERKPRRRTGSL
jgi:transcriptional regulator with XRE-family HTH domain